MKSTTRKYAGPFVYVNQKLAWINTPQGRMIPRELAKVQEIHLRDHLGNTRVVLERMPNGTITDIRSADYLNHPGINQLSF